MKVRMIGRTELRNHIFDRGEIVEITDDEYKARPGCFAEVKDDENDTGPVSGKPAPLSKAALMAKLDQLGVHYKARATVEQLQAQLTEAVDNHPLSTTDTDTDAE